MTVSAFDTLTAARALEAAGIERRQAEAIAEGMRRAAGADRDELATKADLADVRADLYRALWIQAAAFALIVLIVAAGTGVIVSCAPSRRRAVAGRGSTGSPRRRAPHAGGCGTGSSRHSFLAGRHRSGVVGIGHVHVPDRLTQQPP